MSLAQKPRLTRACAKSVEVIEALGSVAGFAATWDWDSTDERFVKGAFAKSIAEQVGKIPLMARHLRDGGDVLDVIGRITHAEETEAGLAIIAPFDASDLAQSMRGKALDGIIRHFSVDYVPLQVRQVDGKTEIVEAALYGVTLTLRPANIAAQITSAKSEQPTHEAGDAHLAALTAERMRMELAIKCMEYKHG